VSVTAEQLKTARRILGGAAAALGGADVLPYATDVLADNTDWPLDQCREAGDTVRAECMRQRAPRPGRRPWEPERRSPRERRAVDRDMRATLEGALEALAAHRHGEEPSSELRTLLARVAGLEGRVGALEGERPREPFPCCKFHLTGGSPDAECGSLRATS
jgi:hypothetical protein